MCEIVKDKSIVENLILILFKSGTSDDDFQKIKY